MTKPKQVVRGTKDGIAVAMPVSDTDKQKRQKQIERDAAIDAAHKEFLQKLVEIGLTAQDTLRLLDCMKTSFSGNFSWHCSDIMLADVLKTTPNPFVRPPWERLGGQLR